MSALPSGSDTKVTNTCRARSAFCYGYCWEARSSREITSIVGIASEEKKQQQKKNKNVSRVLSGEFLGLGRQDQNFDATVASCLKLSDIYRLWSEESRSVSEDMESALNITALS